MKIIKNISLLVGSSNPQEASPRPLAGAEMSSLPLLHDAWMLVDDEKGTVESLGSGPLPADMPEAETVDAAGGCVLPSWCDSHTHIVYAGAREGEFVDKIRGLSYAEIARRGGGILNSSDRLRQAGEDELFASAMHRVREMVAKGTGAIEIKSGYGLDLASELKMLRVIARISEATPAVIRATFLGAHAVGREYAGRQGQYVDMLIRDMLPAVAAEGLAQFVDVFCDSGFFTARETERILEAACALGMRPKIHACELDGASGGVEAGVKHAALSVDHLEEAGPQQIACLREAARGQRPTIATALPGASFFLNMPYAPARKLVDAGVPLAVASDYNPGSSPSGDMKMVVSLACIKMRLLPEEAINAATFNGACAMDVQGLCGSLRPGLLANFFITDPIPSLAFIPYAYTTPLVRRTFLRGREVKRL